MGEREVMKQLFSELVKNSSVKRRGLAQISLLKQEKEARLKGKENEFYETLPKRFTKYLRTATAEAQEKFQELEKMYPNINKQVQKTKVADPELIPNPIPKPQQPIKQRTLPKPVTKEQIITKPATEQQTVTTATKAPVTYETGEFPVIRKNTKMQGDCLFSSIFRSARELGILDIFHACLEVNINSEELFIQGLRDLLAQNIAEDRDGKVSGMYEYLTNTSEQNVNSFQEVFEQMPEWFRNEFEYGLPDDVEKFIEIISEGTGTSGNYVAELEVGIMKDIIKECGIHIELHVTPIQKAKKETDDGEPIIHIINLGPPDYEEGHYEYYSFVVKGGKRKSRKQKK
jgi:hypothetical protein